MMVLTRCVLITHSFYTENYLFDVKYVRGLSWSIGGDLIMVEYNGNRIRLVTVLGAVVFSFIGLWVL